MSGLKSADFCHDEQSLRLLGYASLFCIITSEWKLWNEDSMEAFIDGSRSEECFQEGILRCIQRESIFSPTRSIEAAMGIISGISVTTLLLLLSGLCFQFCTATDTITSTQFIKDPETMVSNGSLFKWVSLALAIPLNATSESGIVMVSEDGNLLDKNSGRITWQSFQHPSHAFLQKMELSENMKTGEKQGLTSWKSPSDPSVGSFSTGIDPSDIPEIFVWNGSRPFWRSGPWNGQTLIGVPDMNYLNGFHIVNDKEGNVSVTFEHAYASILCCLRGYEPRNIEEWSRGNWTGGCVRKTPFQCEKINGSMEEGEADGFIRLTTVKVPDFAEWSLALEDDCKEFCLKNCSCIAYAYYTGIGCMSWSRNLTDVQKFSSNGADLYIRVPYSELDKSRDMKVTVTVTVIIGTIFVAVFIYFSRRWITKRRAKNKKRKEMLSSDRGDVHLNLVTATNNFDEANKLGQGGFGSVYRGRLPEGQEIAVKRLSRASAQGLEEFMNEVVVISKLQHRNLVRLLGCCIEGDEKMLIYEYMPKKSLDALLFDPLRQETLDWKKRFSIIEGLVEDIWRQSGSANTIRVVGTYGYMSPEYAMEGRFSEKSDVFSFGVLLLEIVSGRRNNSFYHDEQSLSLLGYAWKLWNEHNIEALIDGSISEACFQDEILRCIHVGLLCVQELAKDRPSISTVVSMLCSEIACLPTPKKPAFTERQISKDTESLGQSQNNCSVDRASITIIQAR
ncbi:G-type lectin S-receptor-like serine/threonine-protein kinase [Vitis vinifera]|uniref:non-specific serine/threonine protein kinase n=1 Tax=Vitis vinifera TaxID=29760 RepID=A0A438BSB7_VITVI|nr:G-type lectin S-receptor-like serine/threonine-protein kinase [Vitis vinifera]